MGILSPKTRIMDTILTDEGRRQLGTGRFKPAFYSFSDAGAVYSPLDVYATGSVPSSSIRTLLAFEAFPLPQDQVAYEADDSGGLRVFGNNNYFETATGSVRVISGQLVSGWQNGNLEVLPSSAEFASLATSIITGSTENFRNLMLIKSPDIFLEERNEFKLDLSEIEFTINKDSNFLRGYVDKNTLEASQDMFCDRKLSHLDNFKYLPPINKKQNDSSPNRAIGDYSNAVNGNPEIITLEDLRKEFSSVQNVDGTVFETTDLLKQTIRFSETTVTNRLMGQMFEISAGRITKLDVVDFGIFTIPAGSPPLFEGAEPEPLNPDIVSATSRAHVYFVGKVFKDSTGEDKFINIFSLVFQ